MTEETSELAGNIAEELIWHFNDPGTVHYGGETYEFPDDDQWQALGEDPSDVYGPLVLFRPSDGKFFEVEIDVAVHETSPAKRASEREYHAKLAARYQQHQSRIDQASGDTHHDPVTDG